MTYLYRWPRQQPPNQRPEFLAQYPVPAGLTYNVNSFLGRRDVHSGQYLVPPPQYRRFMHEYCEAVQAGYALYCTENYHYQVYKYFVELDWEWDADLALVMEVTPKLLLLIQDAVGEFYRTTGRPYFITSIRTPYKVHLNFPQVMTTELMANLCRDRILDACREHLGRFSASIDWERLVDFPHGSLRLMGSRKAPHMDKDPPWVVEKAYHPARLTDANVWQPGRILPDLLLRASIFPSPAQVAAFEHSPQYLDMIYSDYGAYKAKLEERARLRELRLAGAPPPPALLLPPGSSKLPLHVTLAVQDDGTVKLNVYIKAKFRSSGKQQFVDGRGQGQAGGPAGHQPQGALPPSAAVVAQPHAAASDSAGGSSGRHASTSAVPLAQQQHVSPTPPHVAGSAAVLGDDGAVAGVGPQQEEGATEAASDLDPGTLPRLQQQRASRG